YIDKISLQLTGIAFFYILAEIINQSYKKIIRIIWKLKVIIFLISITVIYIWIEYFNTTITVLLNLNIIFLIIGIASIILSLISSQYKNRIVMLGMILIMIATLSQTVISIINLDVRLTTKIIDLGTLLFVISIIWLAITYYIEMKREKERIREIEFEAVKRENKARNLYSVQLIQSQENERNRIAMELHDSIGQKLLLIKNQVLSRIRNVTIEDDKEILEKISVLSDETISEIRNITHNLRPQYLDQLGLSVAIESIAEKITEISDIEIIHDIDEEVDDIIPQKDQINFYRIIQESLNNIVKHSKADQVFLKIKKEEGNIILEIRDNGIGFDITSNNEGTGLTGIKERSNMLGGVLEIHSDKNGTKIIMNYPIKND
ncbi:MAG: sensor histidine kinase, partial [Melioribacteraceae bacterium]|nr:sensor histidine kinase [Melioribacteraceae bacterium]